MAEKKEKLDFLTKLRIRELILMGLITITAVMANLPSFRIIHGKGTGALRAQVRELLKADRRISTSRPGELFEGGTGVTVVEFR